MEHLITNFINDIIGGNVLFSYFFFFCSAILQMIFPPFPSDFIIIFEGYLTTHANFHFIPILIVSVAGSFVGSLLVYIFGYKCGNEVFRYKFVAKYIDEKHIKRSEKVFHKYGKYGLFISKFIPGTSSLMVLLSGVFKVKKRVYFTYIFLSIVLQQVIYLLIGRAIGNNIDEIKRFMSFFNLSAVIILVVVIVLVYILLKLKRQKSSAKNN